MRAKNDLTKEEVEAVVDYDPETGIFLWKRHRGTTATIKAGRIAGRVSPSYGRKMGGRRQIFIKGRYLYASRLAWLLVTGDWPSDQLDHINGDVLDDRFANLRECTQSQNMANARRALNNTTGFKGVSFVESQNGPNKFKATIKKDNKSIFLGWYPTAEAASAARNGAAAILHGSFARNE